MLTTILIGVAIGAALTLEIMLTNFEVRTKKAWAEHIHVATAVGLRLCALVAENAQMRVSIAAGEMTEEGKKVATMTMAALDAVIAAANEAIREDKPGPLTSQEPVRHQENNQ